MNKKLSVGVALAITVLAMAVTFAITMVYARDVFDATVPAVWQKQVLNNKIAELEKYARGNYYNTIDDNVVNDRTAKGYVDGLQDPYANYYTAAEYTQLQNIENGRLVGIGIEIAQDVNGYYNIAKVYEDSPAAKAGIQAGGRIETVDAIEARSFTSVRLLQSSLRGEVGTVVNLDIRINDAEVQSYTVQRDNYTTPTVSYEVVDGIGYVRITAYSTQTFADFDYALRQCLDAGAQSFVFDVRGMPGTSEVRSSVALQYEQVYKMINLVCPMGTMASAEYKNGTTKLLKTSDENTLFDYPMVVVVNNYTAGPAELFASCIRSLAGGQLVGTTTAGQGMLPSPPYRLNDGSAVTLTVAKLLVVTGTDAGGESIYGSFDGVGLTPEVPQEGTIDDEISFYNVDIRADVQIARATELVRTLARAAGIELPAPAQAVPENSEEPGSLVPESAPAA